jgi:Skp family chaperone for outer membrane proteins
MLTCNVYVQSSELPAINPATKVSVPVAFVIQAEKNADRLKLADAMNVSLQAQVDGYKAMEAEYKKLEGNYQAKIANLEQQVKNTEAALAKSEQNTGLTEQQKRLFEDRLNEYRQELADTRKDLDRANASKKWYFLGGTAVGFGVSKAKF